MGRRSQYPERRDEIVKTIHGLAVELHRTPSVREIADRTGLSIATLHSYLERLSEEGLIEWRAKRHRSLSLTPEGQRLVSSGLPF